MDATDYQELAGLTAIYPGIGGGSPTAEQIDRFKSKAGLIYVLLGLNGEAGEAAEVVKKYIRDGTLDKDKLKKELGDVAWYLARACGEAGFTLSDVMQTNLDKLNDRKVRGVVSGSGDNR
jgi:NTP pyrophosphatase (non-canonical NTP hydrolase)